MPKGIERDKLFLAQVAEGRYTVSEEGVVKKQTGKVIGKPDADFVVIGKDRNYFALTRTRAIWLVYKGPIPEVEGDEYYVVFKDKTQPLHLDNLELKLRTQLSSEVGKRVTRSRSSASMTDEQVLALRREFIENPKAFIVRQRAKELNISHPTLSFALSGRTYAHLTDPVPKELMMKKGGNMRPRVWDRKKCPSYINRPSRAKPASEQVIKRVIPKVDKPKVDKPKVERVVKPKTTNVIEFKKPQAGQPVPPLKVLTEEQKQEKLKRLEMMKRIGQKLAKAKDFD